MSKVAAYRDKRPVVAKPYAPGGCPINVDKEKCGETQGLDIIMDFHKTYQEKMNEIDVSAGGDNLQEKVDLQEQWINDLTEQNTLLARVIEELESETIGKIQQLEDKLNNAVKSFGEEDKKALQEKEKRIEQLNEDLKALPAAEEEMKKKNEENDRLKKLPGIQPEEEMKKQSMSKKDSELPEKEAPKESKDEKTPKAESRTEKDNMEDLKSPEEVSPSTNINDKNEEDKQEGTSQMNNRASSKGSSKNVQPEDDSCHCELEEYLNELDKLKEENKILKDGSEIQRLKEEVEEKMRRILELNEENRTLNDMINMLRKNQASDKQKEPLSDMETISSESDYGTTVHKPTSSKRRFPCRDDDYEYKYGDKHQRNKKFKKNIQGQDHTDKGDETVQFIDVYKREDKGKFVSDSSSTVCNDDICSCLKHFSPINSQHRVRGGYDANPPCPAENYGYLVECEDSTCPAKGSIAPIPEAINAEAIICIAEDISIICANKSCQTEGCEHFEGDLRLDEAKCNVASCLNTVCMEEEAKVDEGDLGIECSDETCPNKGDFEPPSTDLPITQAKEEEPPMLPQELPQSEIHEEVVPVLHIPLENAFKPEGIARTLSICICGIPEECQTEPPPSAGIQVDEKSIVQPQLRRVKCPKGVCDVCTCTPIPPSDGRTYAVASPPRQPTGDGHRICPKNLCDSCTCVRKSTDADVPGKLEPVAKPTVPIQDKSSATPIGEKVPSTAEVPDESSPTQIEDVLPSAPVDDVHIPIQDEPSAIPVEDEIIPIEESSSTTPIDELPSTPPVEDAIAIVPIEELPATSIPDVPTTSPVQDEPSVTPAPDVPLDIPVQEELTTTPVQEEPSVTSDLPSATPVQEELPTTPIQDVPSTTPVPDVPSAIPVQEESSTTPVQDEPSTAPVQPEPEEAPKTEEKAFCAICGCLLTRSDIKLGQKCHVEISDIKADGDILDQGELPKELCVCKEIEIEIFGPSEEQPLIAEEDKLPKVSDKAEVKEDLPLGLSEEPSAAVTPEFTRRPSVRITDKVTVLDSVAERVAPEVQPSEVCSPVCPEAVQDPSLQVTKKASDICTAVCAEPSDEKTSALSEEPSEVCSPICPEAIENPQVPVTPKASEACDAVCSEAVGDVKPSDVPQKSSEAGEDKAPLVMEKRPSEAATEKTSDKPSEAISDKPSEAISDKPSEAISDKPSEAITDKPSEAMSDKPSEAISNKPSEPMIEKTEEHSEDDICGDDICPTKPVEELADDICGDDVCPKKPVVEQVETKSVPRVSQPKPASFSIPSGDDRMIIRCICKSKYCKVVPDPDNPNQKLCIDVSDTNLNSDEEIPCICKPICPTVDREKRVSELANYQNMGPVVTVNQLYQMTKDTENLSKEQEYAGLSRKDSLTRRIAYIAPRKASSRYGFQDEDLEYSGNEEMRKADLKLVIADLKSKLLDAEDKIDELKAGKDYTDKDNDTTLMNKYSEEINELKKSLKWSKKERDEYEYLKQRVKLLEQGKGDTDNITSNLQTAEEKIVIKNQLKKLTKKNKCYEEVVQFFKDEMSVMSDELLTLQEVLNVTNVNSQEENNKLIGAILQLRRINDRLVGHLCTIEKQAILENQINQINEARISELQSIISAKNNDLNQHDDVIQDMRKKLNNATRQNADLKKTIKNLTDTVVEIQEGIKSIEREQKKNLNDVTLVESKVCLANGNLEEIKTCMGQKNSRILELENKIKNQEVNYILATKELGMLKEKKVESKELINSLKDQLSIAEKKNEQITVDYRTVVKKLQDYSSLEHMKNYELNHYKSLVEELKLNLGQLNNGLEKCAASNIHYYEDARQADPHRRSNMPIVFDELKKSMADLKRKLSEADFKGGLIEEELLKVKESHMLRIPDDGTDTQKELEEKIISSIEEQTRLNELIEDQREEIERLRTELEEERADASYCKRSVSELKNEKTSSNAQMEISQLKCELNKSFHRQKLLNEENDQLHTEMVNLRKKLHVLEEAYDSLKQENEDYKMRLKRTVREKEYLNHKNHEMAKTIEQMRSTHDQLEKQCRTMMKKMSQERSWTTTPMQQPFSPRRYGTGGHFERRTASPIRIRKMEKQSADTRYRSSSPWRDNVYEEFLPEETNSHKSHIMRNISYDSNSSPYTSRSPSPRSTSLHDEEEEFDDLNTSDWMSPDYKETDTDLDDFEDGFIGRIHSMTAQVQEANRKWQRKMNINHLSKSRTGNK